MCPPSQTTDVDPDFLAYWEKLTAAAKAKSWVQLKPLLWRQITYSFGDDNPGPQGFLDYYEILDEEPSTVFWQRLSNLLRIGYAGDQEDGSYVVPYFFYSWPEQWEPTEGYDLVTGDHVNVREKPSLSGKRVGQLHHQVVWGDWGYYGEEMLTETIGGETHTWVKVKSVDGKIQGYLWSKFLHSPYGLRAGFEKKDDGRYYMTFLVEGD